MTNAPEFKRQCATAGSAEQEALRRKRRQGSENRNMAGRLQVRFDTTKLRELEAAAGTKLPALIRQCGDLLTELVPVAEQQGIDPVELIRRTAASLLDRTELLSA
ncbi:hypothetical protein OSH39_12740 [Mycobacterium ulcerans]|uniref:Uncharacterized protein n=4 Tax=Mycobacterium ulcerans group TaxID=2993898 RepID=A0A1B4YA22_MYCUL|nr:MULTISPECIES: hypothetical protein [Mycobacterium ulcerans group]ACA57577.1 hypothetical protein MULP_002 [Mycobacterium liflandii 128FXT]MEB3905708.1 hypothetical protein [Mycobacterium ulcerans]MEB3909883.1 hypothetical protein [Mycobacterium ulcerans]MEB3920146.1 hypothetical protein [Mycobacterium ulcerans]MEB3924264.1 hypothetical protein [Mycobacterium ulcerans]